MYCGNNILIPNKGNNYQCLKKGIIMGKRNTNLRVYIQDKIKDEIYCGAIPSSDIKIGTLDECFRKGIGIGLKKSFDENLQKLINDINVLITEDDDEL